MENVHIGSDGEPVGSDSLERFRDRGPRGGDAGIHQQLAVASRENTDVSTRPLEHEDVSAIFFER